MRLYFEQLSSKIDFSKEEPLEILAKYEKVKEFIKKFKRFISVSDDLLKKAIQIRPAPNIFELKNLEKNDLDKKITEKEKLEE